MTKLVYFSLMFIFGVVCYVIAKKRKLPQPWIWFILGMAIHVVAVVIVSRISSYVSANKDRGSS